MIEVKNVKICQWMSEETLAFECSVYYKNKRVGYAKNDGKGGCNYIDVPNELYKEMDKWCKDNLPKWGFPEVNSKLHDMDLELHISELVRDFDDEQFLKRQMKNWVLVFDDDCKKGGTWRYSKKTMRARNENEKQLFEDVKDRFHKGKNPILINELPIKKSVSVVYGR